MAPFASFLFATTAQATMQRGFRFVPFGAQFEKKGDDASRPTISCDGRIPGDGVTLELTHWNGNLTPDRLYADTSTEMALNLPVEELSDALVLNNHFDTDGVLSVWACLEPELARDYRDLLIEGAEAGDFGEWSSDRGVKLNMALLHLLSQEEGDEPAFHRALQELPSMLESIDSYEEWWGEEWEETVRVWKDFDPKQQLHRGPGKIVIADVSQTEGELNLNPYVLDRGLRETGLWEDTTRVLLACNKSYQYQKIGHGWVAKVVKRSCVPGVDNAKLIGDLNANSDSEWTTSGYGGLVGICRTARPTGMEAEEIARVLSEYDGGAT